MAVRSRTVVNRHKEAFVRSGKPSDRGATAFDALAPGDTVSLPGDDGEDYRYTVSWTRRYDLDAVPVGDVIGTSESEVVTLMTCIGTWDTARGTCRERLVVRAIRQP